MNYPTFFAVAFIIFCQIISSTTFLLNNDFKRLAYYTSWTQESDLTPDKVNATLLTHLIFASAVIRNDSLVPRDPQDPQRFQELAELRSKSPQLKLMISLACGSGDRTLSNIVSQPDRRAVLVNSTVLFLKKYGFDGLDIDWEFPAWDGAPLTDKNNFALLLKEFREEFNKEEVPFILSIAVSAAWTIIIPAYNVPEINKYVDFVNLMTYDFHLYSWLYPFTGHNSPLFKRKDEILVWASLNTAWAANFWLKRGMSKEKVLVGLPTYGTSWILKYPQRHGFGAPALGENGALSYHQICPFLENNATRVFDNESKVPYAYKNVTWIAYDDEESFTEKCNWVKAEQFGGAFTWSLNHDDWKNACGQQMFPLHTIIYNILS